MNKYLVKALVAKEGRSASLRFVPLEIYDLWKAHMQTTYHYRVSAVEVSLWVASESAMVGGVRAEIRGESVVQVRLAKKIGLVAMPVERYFLEEDLPRFLPTFLKHYGIDPAEQGGMGRVHLQNGIFLDPDEVFEDEF